MSVARRAAGAVSWLGVLGRLTVVVVLLGALWFGTVSGVERASRGADSRRAADRTAVARAFADSVKSWLDAGRSEVGELSRAVGSASEDGRHDVIASFLSTRRTFTSEALVFIGPSVSAASSSYSVLVGLEPKPCTRTDEQGATSADTKLADLVIRTRTATTPLVSAILEVPGDCEAAVAIAQSFGSLVVVALGDIDDVAPRLAAGSLITDAAADGDRPAAGTRILLITGDLALEPRDGVITPPNRVTRFVSEVGADKPTTARYTAGGKDGTEVMAAFAPVGEGWSIVLEQDAAVFDIELQNRPSLIVATVLTVVFAITFALLALFDVRRRRAHRRAEVAKNAFFSIAGHELRTPLTALKGFADMLATHWNDLPEDKRQALVERMVPQTRRLDRLVERLLVAASIQAETYTRPEIQDVDPVAVVEDVVAQFRPQAPLHAFSVVPRPGVENVRADPRSLDLVLQYLIENAVKYSPSGGEITLSVLRDGRGVHLVVDDEGIGLPSDHKHIFEKFVQGESVTKRVHDEGGVGLGLYIVRTLVEQMGGSVRAEARPAGARFVVTLRPAPMRATQGSARTVGRPA